MKKCVTVSYTSIEKVVSLYHLTKYCFTAVKQCRRDTLYLQSTEQVLKKKTSTMVGLTPAGPGIKDQQKAGTQDRSMQKTVRCLLQCFIFILFSY